jgi:outer membrane protein
MNLRPIAIMALVLSAGSVQAQFKLGYADINGIMGVMPEREKINEDLQTYALGLQKMLEDVKAQRESAVEKYQAKTQAKDTTGLGAITNQAITADQNFQKASQQAEGRLAEKRAELMKPVVERVEKAIAEIAKEGGYTYILNSVDGSGTSNILFGPPTDNVTLKVVAKLGIKLEGQDQAAPAPAPGKK